jgi:argininosuccinate lyase
MSKLLRGGRIDSIRKEVIEFTSSIKSDKKLLRAVIDINKTHVLMLIEQKIIDKKFGKKLLRALVELEQNTPIDYSSEDIHLVIEEEVNKKVGSEIGGNLHIGKSRNDQVATAIRMELRIDLLQLMSCLVKLQISLVTLAEKHIKTIVPAYTHLHPAQPVTFAHILLSYFDMLKRDLDRLDESFFRINQCPMGAGAIATTSFPIDREFTNRLLGFDKILENSIDAVGSRDFILETLAVLSLIAVNISRMVEDFILWSSPDFGIIDLPESFAFTSSIMPQKKNPDLLEIIRARMNSLLGNFFGSISTMMALPSGYNLDFQEITPKLWNSIKTIDTSIQILSQLIPNLKINKEIIKKPIIEFITSTELANMLVRNYQIPFRISHKIVGAVVKNLVENNLTLSNITSDLLNRTALEISNIVIDVKNDDIIQSIDPQKVVNSHKIKGGPAPAEVERMLKNRKLSILKTKKAINFKKRNLSKTEKKLESTIKSILQKINEDQSCRSQL